MNLEFVLQKYSCYESSRFLKHVCTPPDVHLEGEAGNLAARSCSSVWGGDRQWGQSRMGRCLSQRFVPGPEVPPLLMPGFPSGAGDFAVHIDRHFITRRRLSVYLFIYGLQILAAALALKCMAGDLKVFLEGAFESQKRDTREALSSGGRSGTETGTRDQPGGVGAAAGPMCAARAHEWRGRGFQEAPPPPGTSQSLCGVLPPPSLAGRGRYICIRLAHSRSRFPGRPDCVSPAPPSCPHLARRPPAALPRAGHGSPAPLRARLEPWCCPPGSSGLIGFSRRSPGSGGRRITSQISVCVCVYVRARG